MVLFSAPFRVSILGEALEETADVLIVRLKRYNNASNAGPADAMKTDTSSWYIRDMAVRNAVAGIC